MFLKKYMAKFEEQATEAAAAAAGAGRPTA